MSKFSSEILLALAYVSQIKDPNSVRSRFIESLNALDDAIAFNFVDRLPPGLPENRVMPITTLRSSFGFAVIAEGPETTETDRAVFRNAFQFLAVLLENRLQASALASKNESLLKEISQEKSLVRTVLDTLPVGVWVADGEGTIVMGNAAGEKIWAGIRYIGIDQYSEYKGRWSDTGERIKQEEWALARAIKMGETSINEEIDIECFDGTHKTVLNSAAPLLDDERRIIGAFGINQDITERKQAEIEIRESEERFRAIFQRSTVGKSLTLPDGKLLQINQAFADMLGYSIEEFQQLNFAQITHLDDVAENRECIRILLADEQTAYRMEKRYIHKNGDIVWADVSTTLLRDEQGTPLYFITSIVDITDRRKAEEALQHEKILYEDLVTTQPSGVYRLRVKLRGDWQAEKWRSMMESTYSVDMASDRFCTILGISQEEFVANPGVVPDVIHPDDQQDFNAKNAQAMTSLTHFTWEGRISRHHQTRWVHLESIPRVIDSETVLWTGIVYDVTERKRSEEELLQTLESLRKAVATTIKVMVSAVETRDPYTAGHQIRSADLASAIATEMDLSQDKIEGIHMAGSIHDIGKLSIPAEILSKPTKLTNIEFSLIKEHSLKGYEILKDVVSPWPLAQIVYQHHERMDGSGYPRNLKGKDICMEARILSVADVVEAMASHRPYRPGLGIDAALHEIEKNKGIFYDEVVADACLRLFREKGFQLIS